MSTRALDKPAGYATFAPYYRVYAGCQSRIDGTRGINHFNRQIAYIPTLVPFGGRPRILDAACGTGDVMKGLLDKGLDVYGLDGSPEMLGEGYGLLGNEWGRIFPPQRWEAINAEDLGQFDLVFLLGQALSHIPNGSVPGVLVRLFKILKSGGLLVFDYRYWKREGCRCETQHPGGHWREGNPERRPGEWMACGAYALDGRTVRVADVATYEDSEEKQIVVYRVSDSGCSEELLFAVEYYPFGEEDTRRWCTDAGMVEWVAVPPEATGLRKPIIRARRPSR